MTELGFVPHPLDKLLCVHTTIVDYLDRTNDIRGLIIHFFLTARPPIRMASQDTLRQWTWDTMEDAIVSPHFARYALPSKAALKLPLSTILSTVNWDTEFTLERIYKKPLNENGGFATAVLSMDDQA